MITVAAPPVSHTTYASPPAPAIQEEAIREENTSSDEEEDAQRAHESPRRAAVVAPPGAKEAKKGRQPAAQAPQQPEEDIDAILQELNITPINPSGVSSPARGTASTSAKPLLALNAKALKPDEELKRMFGRSALSTHDDDEDGGGAYAGASRRIRRLAARGLLVKHQLRPGVVIAPKDTWPRLDASLGMKLSGRTENGRPIFTYTHSPAFEVCVDG